MWAMGIKFKCITHILVYVFRMNHNLTRKADDRGRVNLGSEYADKDVEISVKREVDVSSLPTMRAVHFLNHLDKDQEIKARLYSGVDHDDADALFGVHWGTGPVWAKSAYEERNRNHQSAIKDYNGMEKAADGALVSSYYGARKNEREGDDPYCLNKYLVIGICPPGSSVQAIPFENSSGEYTFIKALPIVNSVEISRENCQDLFEDNVKGLSIYESSSKQELIREAYRQEGN